MFYGPNLNVRGEIDRGPLDTLHRIGEDMVSHVALIVVALLVCGVWRMQAAPIYDPCKYNDQHSLQHPLTT